MSINNLNGLELGKLNGLQNGNQNVTGKQQETEELIGLSLSNGNEIENIDEIEAGYLEAAEAVGNVSGASSEEIAAEIEELEEEKAENMEKMEKLEDEIEDLAKEAEENIMKAVALQEAAVKDHEEETQAALHENIQAYINANKEGGKGMTRDELQSNIKKSLPNTPDIADAVAALTAASELVNEIDSCLGELNKLITDTQLLTDLIDTKQGEYEAAKAAEEAAAAAKSCDPIGFTFGEGEDKAQYDFIIDDGAFDSTDDFLGAQDQWAEMKALDTDGSNIVTADELQKGNIKAVKTTDDGAIEIVDIVEEFGANFSIDLNSYKRGGSHDAVDTNADDDNDGVKNQSLLGTFNLNINGESVKGYNTLDDVEYLSENYSIDIAEPTESDMQYSEELQSHVNFFNLYTEKSEMLKEQIAAGFETIGLSQEQIDNINETTKKEADEQSQNFFASINLTEDQMNTENTNTSESKEEEEEEKEELLNIA